MSFLSKITALSEKTLATGSLCFLPSTSHRLIDQGFSFSVRIIKVLEKKPRQIVDEKQENSLQGGEEQIKAKQTDPFENPQQSELFVDQVGSKNKHSVLLNKFTLVPNHILVVTNQYEPQTNPLTTSDFDALSVSPLLSSLDPLIFYNCGPLSGASQPHKHLQLIPKNQLIENGELPIEKAFVHLKTQTSSILQAQELPFKHGFCWLERNQVLQPNPEYLEKQYKDLLKHASITLTSSYNFLMTCDCMLLVPRSQEFYETTISVNSLGFSGCLAVKSEEDFERVKIVGPMKVLSAVSFPKEN